jgi:hypothetical protein
MELVLFCMIAACCVDIAVCIIGYALVKEPTYDDFEKLRKDLAEWYQELSDEERKQVNDKGIYAGWNRK